MAETTSPAFLAVHPNGRFLYAVNEMGDYESKKSGGVSAFAIDLAGSFLFAANQDSGNVVLFRIDPQTGGLTPTGHVLEVPSSVCVAFLPVD